MAPSPCLQQADQLNTPNPKREVTEMSLSFEGIVFIIISKGCTVELEFLKTLMLCIGEVSNSKKELLSTPTGKELSLVI